MAAPTGRRPGRPPAVARKVRLAALDAADEALGVLTKAVRLGDVEAAGIVLKLALGAADPEARPDR